MAKGGMTKNILFKIINIFVQHLQIGLIKRGNISKKKLCGINWVIKANLIIKIKAKRILIGVKVKI